MFPSALGHSFTKQPEHTKKHVQHPLSCLIYNRLEVNNLSWTPLTWSLLLLLWVELAPAFSNIAPLTNLLCVFNLPTKNDTPNLS
jgi:hypothetical protein